MEEERDEKKVKKVDVKFSLGIAPSLAIRGNHHIASDVFLLDNSHCF